MLRHKIVTHKFLDDLISTIPITLSSICWVCHPQPKIDIISFGDATQEGVKGGGSRSRFTKNKIGISRFMEKKENVFPYTKVTYRFILKNNVQSKVLFVFSLFVHLAFCMMQKGNRVPCSAYHEWHHLPEVVIVFGELIVSWVPRCRRAFSSLFL